MSVKNTQHGENIAEMGGWSVSISDSTPQGPPKGLQLRLKIDSDKLPASGSSIARGRR